MKRVLPWLWIAAAACSTSLPARFVIERDLGGYRYRRYQETLEAELPIAGNRAHGHTAAYMRRAARGPGVAAITAFVTVYERPLRLTETLRAELAALPGFELHTESIAGHYAWVLGSNSESEASFWIWSSGQYVVKLGAPAGLRVPDAIADAYAALYPSDLDSFGHAREGAASGGTEPDAEDADEAKATQSAANPGSKEAGALAEAGGPR
jgi:hypothetical protein